MTSIENNAWQGPLESRAAFEAFQDESIGRLVDYAHQRPLLTDIPEQLEVQLWEIGKYLPAAILGLGRYNPNATTLHVFDEDIESIVSHDYSKGHYISGPTILKGTDAYERIVNSWHDIDNIDAENKHRFGVNSVRETAHELEVSHSGKTYLLISDWVIEGRRASGAITLPDTSRDHNIADEQWTMSEISASGSVRRGLSYFTTPLKQSSMVESDLSVDAVRILAGEAAVKALQEYGPVGLYQQLAWAGMRQLIAGLHPGSNITS